jgi:hypothetical protein
MSRITFSGENVSISYVWEWYRVSEKAIRGERKRVLDSLLTKDAIEDRFVGMNREDIESYFEAHLRELELLACFDIIAAAEGYLRLEYLNRVYKRLKDAVSRKLRDLYKERGPRIRLDEDILGAFAENHPACKKAVGQFRAILGLRDWLAHGRYWKAKLGRETWQYTPEDALEAAEQLFDILPSWFIALEPELGR